MIIGVPKEIKNNENRVAMTPAGVKDLISNGHNVYVEVSAGIGSGFTDQEYIDVGAKLVSAEKAWEAEMVVKVKEPLTSEYKYFREDLILYTYLHLAAEPELTKALIDKKVTAIAYETVQLKDNSLPLLVPMSEVAGRMAAQIGAQFLEKIHGGKGILLSGVTGVDKGEVTVIGAGIAGTNAVKIAVGLGARVNVIDLNIKRLQELETMFGDRITTLMSTPDNIALAVKRSDLVIGAVLIPGAKTPTLVTEEMVKSMQPGSVIIDIAIDQGGIFATTDKVTTHDDPVYIKHNIVHYAVANMPGAVPRTSTIALTNSTIRYAREIANKGYRQACLDDHALMKGLNTHKGFITYEAVAKDLGYEFKTPESVL